MFSSRTITCPRRSFRMHDVGSCSDIPKIINEKRLIMAKHWKKKLHVFISKAILTARHPGTLAWATWHRWLELSYLAFWEVPWFHKATTVSGKKERSVCMSMQAEPRHVHETKWNFKFAILSPWIFRRHGCMFFYTFSAPKNFAHPFVMAMFLSTVLYWLVF